MTLKSPFSYHYHCVHLHAWALLRALLAAWLELRLARAPLRMFYPLQCVAAVGPQANEVHPALDCKWRSLDTRRILLIVNLSSVLFSRGSICGLSNNEKWIFQ